ncbi:hypothetical protein U9M48_002819 [Paspalum notatum var. saurae]|uniref:Reverse transcriptase zinc-binding domain-containing protein n=1 Tax=Paspalum notatum var. saurae TaxID=547442 RepID=A0AAQ3PHR1_PASNO
MYMMSFFAIPKGVLKKLDYLRSRFYWQGDDSKKKYCLAKWNILWGLGIHDLYVKNIALLSKWLFKLLTSEGTWQQLLKNKYLSSKPLVQVDWKPGDSHFWASLMKAKHEFFRFGTFRIRNGSQHYKKKIHNHRRSFVFSTTKYIIKKTLGLGMKSHYQTLIKNDVPNLNKRLWKLKAALKIKVFLWYLRRGVILTKDNLAKRKWKGSLTCCFCHEVETIKHMFFDCRFTRMVWNIIYLSFGISRPFSASNMFKIWLSGFERDNKKLSLQLAIGYAHGVYCRSRRYVLS